MLKALAAVAAFGSGYALPAIPEARPMFPRGLAAPAWRGAAYVPPPSREALLGRLSPAVRDRAPERGARWPRWALRVLTGRRRPRNARERAAVAEAERIAHADLAERWAREEAEQQAREAADLAEALRAQQAEAVERAARWDEVFP